MYLLKFAEWFWTTHLKNGEQRFFFCLFGMILGFGPVSVAAWFFGANMYLWYLGILLGTATFIGIMAFISFIHHAYIKWQAQVFDKLRNTNGSGGDGNQTSGW